MIILPINQKIKLVKGIKRKAEQLSKLYYENIDDVDKKELINVYFFLKRKMEYFEEELENGKNEKRG